MELDLIWEPLLQAIEKHTALLAIADTMTLNCMSKQIYIIHHYVETEIHEVRDCSSWFSLFPGFTFWKQIDNMPCRTH